VQTKVYIASSHFLLSSQLGTAQVVCNLVSPVNSSSHLITYKTRGIIGQKLQPLTLTVKVTQIIDPNKFY